ncbi:MAG: hypothetical protein A3A22_00385 [Candidatus Taylorbacteria bacterium RIFCSPLOWO2_01_FULL_45_34b]|nr:MAG: hypothetical protein A3A22_00385 [Candidatus Taylorbacteria bacterium RIFCSPLOWO2_01_FULL_45_34b]
MVRLTKTFRLLVILLLLNGALLSGYIFSLYKLKVLYREVAEARSELLFKSDKDTSLQYLKNVLHETEGERALLDSYFVGKDGIIDFIKKVEELGRGNNLGVDTQSVAVVPGVEPFLYRETLQIGFETLGSWEDTIHFLNLLEALPYRVTLLRVSLVHEATEKGKSEWRATLKLSALKLK